LGGCASAPERVLSKKAPAYAVLPNGHDPLNPDQLSPIYAAAAGGEANIVRQLERKHGRALNILSLSGGGQNGAFGAGLLIGWRESGKRPEFDIVGGVSTGALLATHALLGTPADDAQLEEMYTQITKKDVYIDRPILSLAAGADSLADTAPLRALIAKHITEKTLERVAAAYKDNRLLVVGTTNIDYSQTWVWNMSQIAKDGNLALYRATFSSPLPRPPSSPRRSKSMVTCSSTGPRVRTLSSPGWVAPSALRLHDMEQVTFIWLTTACCIARPRLCAEPSVPWLRRPS